MATTKPMATMLDLPREIYLSVTSLLSTKDLARLAGVSRDHYLAVQHPLFSHIRLTSYGSLVKLIGTLMKIPIVSHISPKQRLHWHRLSDSQLRERDIRHLDLILDSKKDGPRITGVVLSRCISAIARKCEDVKITLMLLGLSDKLVKELSNVSLPNVGKLSIFLGGMDESESLSRAGRTNQVDPLRKNIWALSMAGSTFPDLRTFYFNSLVGCPEDMPTNMEDGFTRAERARPRRRRNYTDSSDSSEITPFYGLLGMREIVLEYNTLLDADILKSLFGSTVVPKFLKKLEIVNCPALHPIRDLENLATLLQRGLQLLDFLKLHLTWAFDGHDGFETAYVSKINSYPEHHLCNVVRELGQRIKGLDLAVPFACDHIFVPLPKNQTELINMHELELPDIPEDPVNTLPQRPFAAGYRYRRLIFNQFCRDIERWDEMANLAGRQGEKVSWELLYDGYEPKAMWFVSGCQAVEFSVQGAMQHPFSEE